MEDAENLFAPSPAVELSARPKIRSVGHFSRSQDEVVNELPGVHFGRYRANFSDFWR